jgi:hypothetical protein
MERLLQALLCRRVVGDRLEDPGRSLKGGSDQLAAQHGGEWPLSAGSEQRRAQQFDHTREHEESHIKQTASVSITGTRECAAQRKTCVV